MKILSKIEPQPPQGIKYMIGGEPWLPAEKQTPIHLHCEEWGNLGPAELNREIPKNAAGFRVRCTSIPAPAGAIGFKEVDGVYYWTDTDCYGRTETDASASCAGLSAGTTGEHHG
jgi:hypothetical protein